MKIEIKNLKKHFSYKQSVFAKKKEVKAVDQIDLIIKSGENVGLVGESGSGKTTLGRLIMKLLPIDSGQILFDGQDICLLSRKKMRPYRKDIQMVFQDPYSSLDPRFSVRQIFLEAMYFEKNLKKHEKIDRMEKLLDAVGLPKNILGRYPHEFSGGERQRIAIARALVRNPKLLILDEAVSSLDVLVQKQIIDLLIKLQKEFDVTYLFISHNLGVIRKICSKIAVMYKGKIVECARAEEIFSNPLHQYTKRLLKAAIEYKATDVLEDFSFGDSCCLFDKGDGHFVLEH